MIQYIYFVKCPNCEDEPFDFFDEAKNYAMGCLGNQPIITQTEVNRNDFGECVDSTDCGTIWSWEDVATVDNEPAITTFKKSDLGEYDPDQDDEFALLDNSLDVLDQVPDNFRKPIPADMSIKDLVEEMEKNEDEVECTWCEELFDKSECRYEVDLGWLCSSCEAAIKSRGETLTFRENNYWDFLDECVEEPVKESVRDPFDHHDPEYDELIAADELARMTDTAVDDKYDHDFLDPLLSTRESLTNNKTWTCFFDDEEVGSVEAATEDEAIEKMQKEYPEFNYGDHDGCFGVELKEAVSNFTIEDVEDFINHAKESFPGSEAHFDGDANKIILTLNNTTRPYTRPDKTDVLDVAIKDVENFLSSVENQFPGLEAYFNGDKNEIVINLPVEIFNESKLLSEGYDPDKEIDLEYNGVETTVFSDGSPSADEVDVTLDGTYSVPASEIASLIWDRFITDEDVEEVSGGLDALYEDHKLWEDFLDKNFDKLLAKYYDQILEFYAESAAREIADNYSWSDYRDDEAGRAADYWYDYYGDR